MADSTTVCITKINNVSNNNPIPQYATNLSAGMDLTANIAAPLIIEPGQTSLIPTGIAIALPKGYEAQIRPRSGLAAKKSITVLNSPGTIDADYRGEIGAVIINHSKENFTVTPNMRIAQMVITEYTRVEWNEVESLDETERSLDGFGSTGT